MKEVFLHISLRLIHKQGLKEESHTFPLGVKGGGTLPVHFSEAIFLLRVRMFFCRILRGNVTY